MTDIPLHDFIEDFPIRPHSALIAIDVQSDFMPGGPLACTDGDKIVAPLNALLALGRFSYVVATQDWHPADHVSFASQHDGHAPFDTISLHAHPQVLWPDHCIIGSTGAALHNGIDWRFADLILRKGSNPAVDSYSAFRHNINQQGKRPSTGLSAWLRDLGITDVYLCGLARDVCVLWSAQDAASAGFNVHFLWPITRPVSYKSNNATLATLADAGVNVLGQALSR